MSRQEGDLSPAMVEFERIDAYRLRIPKAYKPGMRVDGMLYADERLLPDILRDNVVEQVANVAFLPGIVGNSLAMPDMHWGYGFPIGGVAATDIDAGGVVSPGGVGFDINCGVRLLTTSLTAAEVRPRLETLIETLFDTVPAGIGSHGPLRLRRSDYRKLMCTGAAWAVRQGMGVPEDLLHCEDLGCLADADPAAVSEQAVKRGTAQAGTLGSGNHFLEIQQVERIFDEATAQVFDLQPGRVVVMIHSGSRGFGHQICSDALHLMQRCLRAYDIQVPDRQLACAPVGSPEARQYLSAMRCAANYAWANRQILTHLSRQAFARVFGTSWRSLGMRLLYDLSHNIAKFETHSVDGTPKVLCVHRKGATRAFGPAHPELPDAYKKIGQPVIIPGDMGRHSYVLVGTGIAMRQSWGSTCHGAGRRMSRSEAVRTLDRRDILRQLQAKGIVLRTAGKEIVCEEAPQAYKDVNEVVEVVHQSGLAGKVCRLRPLGVVKG